MIEHTVKAFDTELETLGRQIAEMGGMAEKMLADAMDALMFMNIELGQKVVAADPRVDALKRIIEESAVRTVARRQPFAVDRKRCAAPTWRFSSE